MNDLIPQSRTEGEAIMDGENIYEKKTDVVLAWCSSAPTRFLSPFLRMSPMDYGCRAIPRKRLRRQWSRAYGTQCSGRK
jgi:hypothetical protein